MESSTRPLNSHICSENYQKTKQRTWKKNGLNKKDLFFHGIEESVRFSVRCKENELHRKYKGFGGSTENASRPILRIEQNLCFHWINTTQCVQNYPVCSFIFENKLYIIFWPLHKFYLKKRNFMNLFKKSYHWIRYLRIFCDTHFIPLQNEPSPILVGPKLGEE